MKNIADDKQKILIVDDSPINLDLLKEILTPEYKVFAAVKGRIALKIAQTQAPDLILLDIMMPGMDGYEVCRKLKADENTFRIPVIFVSAKDDPMDEFKGFDAGCVDYITKPFSPIIVSARVKNHLALSTALGTLEQQNEELKKAAKLKEDVERISRHDLKNPMSAIFSRLYFLRKDPRISDKSKAHIEAINESAKDMLDMINHSLDMFKMEQNFYKTRLTDVDLTQTIERIKNDLSALSGARDSRILVTGAQEIVGCCPEGCHVSGEPLLIYSMLVNLLKNALEATPAGEPVTITMKETKQNVELIIHNQGAVPQSIRHTVFDKFVTSGKQSGTGLGTYSARLIARTLGGDITMKTCEQKGTYFTVSLARGGSKA